MTAPKTPANLREKLKPFQGTPHAASESALRPHAVDSDPLAAECYPALAQDIKPRCVGPMPENEFLALLPWPKPGEVDEKKPSFNTEAFITMATALAEKPGKLTEKEVYEPLVCKTTIVVFYPYALLS